MNRKGEDYLRLVQTNEDGLGLDRPASPLQTGDGDGTSGGMEARVAKLEAHMEHVRADVTAMKSDVSVLKTDVAGLKVKVDHLPSKGFIVTTVVGTGAVLAALGAFGPALLKLAGH